MLLLHRKSGDLFIFLGFYLSQKLIEVLLILDSLFFRGLGFGQSHGRTDYQSQRRPDIRTILLCKDAKPFLFRIFAVIGNQPTSRYQTAQTSNDRTVELTAVPIMSFLMLFSSRFVSSRMS